MTRVEFTRFVKASFKLAVASLKSVIAIPAFVRIYSVFREHKQIERSYEEKCAARRLDRIQNPEKYRGKDFEDEFD